MSKVALYHCDSTDEIKPAIEKIFDSLGKEEISRLFSNKKVLLKPNLCIDHGPEKGATTHPKVVEAVIRIALEYNAKVIVGDGAAIGVKGNVARNTGIEDICRKYDVPFVDFNRDEGKIVKIDNAYALNEANIAKTYFEVDTVVNMPVFKSNMLFWVSGALKNMKGLLVGMEKHKPHYLGVAQCVSDLNRMVKQDLIIMDGFVGMMGDGPTAGKPANSRLLIGGFDPVAVDSLAASLMGLPVKKIPMIQYAKQAHIGDDYFEVVGDPLKSFNLAFEKPAVSKNRLKANILNTISKNFFRNAGKKSKIIVDKDKCTLCLRCKEMCPYHAITLIDKTISIEHDKCEFCLCCTEVCKSEAIKLKGMLVGKEVFLKKV